MKRLLLLSSLVLFTKLSMGQSMDLYVLEVENGKPYVPLTSGTNLTAGLVWDEENFKIPLGFTANIGDKTITDFSILTTGVLAPASDTADVVHAFIPLALDIRDRAMDGIPKSPIRYEITGASPTRIFKLEFANAGSADEIIDNMTNADSVNFQVWLYETSNIVEFRYGSSYLDYATLTEDPLIGYGKNLNLSTFDFSWIYFLKGDFRTPEIDSSDKITFSPSPLIPFPESGTVYRFVPKGALTSVGEIDVTKYFSVYPTQVQDFLTIDYGMSGEASAQLIDLSGRSVQLPVALQSGSNRLDVSQLPRGQYFVRVSTTEGNAVYRFTKL